MTLGSLFLRGTPDCRRDCKMVRRLTLVPSLVFAACASPTGNDVLLSSLASSARCEQPPVWHAPNDRTHPTRTGHSAVPLAGTPFAVAVSDKGVVYVTQAHAGSAARADLPATQFSASFPVGDLPSQVRIHPNGKTAYVSDQDARTITYVDVASNQAVATVVVPAGSILTTGLSPEGDRLYALTDYFGVDEINTATHEAIGSLPAPVTGSPPTPAAPAPL